jgi:hypothetical protein
LGMFIDNGEQNSITSDETSLHHLTDPWFVRWLDYSTPHLVRDIGNMRYEDRAASLFSGEHVLSQGIYVVGYK